MSLSTHANCSFLILKNFNDVDNFSLHCFDILRVNILGYFLNCFHHHNYDMLANKRNISSKLCLILIHFNLLQFFLHSFVYFMRDRIFRHEQQKFNNKHCQRSKWDNLNNCENHILKFKKDHEYNPFSTKFFQDRLLSSDLQFLHCLVDENTRPQKSQNIRHNVVKIHQNIIRIRQIYKIQHFYLINMTFEIDSKTFKWLVNYKLITPSDVKQLSSSSFEIKNPPANQFENGTKISLIVIEIYKKVGLPIPATLNHLKQTNGTAAQLYNWNILNDALKKVNFQIDSETKNLIINGDRLHLAMVIRKLIALSQNSNMEDSLAQYQKNNVQQKKLVTNQSLTLSRSQQPQRATAFNSQNLAKNLQQNRKPEGRTYMAKGDLIQFVVNQLMQNLKLSKKQAIALLSDNNKYLAHVFVKGVKGQFTDIQYLLQRFFSQTDYIIQKMTEQNDMCFYFLQIIKPCLLSKSQQIAQWGCRILTKIAHQLAVKQLLPLAYDWFVQEAGGLSTTILALTRHPKLNQNVVGYILEFSRYNVTELFTIELRKITNNDNLIYVKFMLLIFGPLTQSKISAEELLQSGAIDYWIETTLKGAQNEQRNTKQQRMYCIQFLIKIWRAYPAHIEQTLDQVNNIMNQIKRGIRDQSQTMRFTLMQMMFDLLDEFANKKNPYASIVYKKLTFLFIENHQQLTMRQFILRNLQVIFQKYQSIPVQIFLQPFIKQIKISESKSYLVNIFDMEFINVAVKHRKLKVGIGLELFDLLAKTKLNSYSFSIFATDAMEVLLQRFLGQDIFLQYTVKLVKISLAMFYSTLKHKKPYEDQERLQAQKRAQIVNMIISLIERSNTELNEQIKNLVVHVKVQILNRIGIQHKGIERILGYFKDVEEAVKQAMQNAQDQINSNAASTAKQQKSAFHLPKIQNRNVPARDQNESQQSLRSSLRSRNTKYSQSSKQQFPIKDYRQFAEQDEKKFLKQNGLGLKKKPTGQKKTYSAQKQAVDPKVQQNLIKIKVRKQEQQKKKINEREQMQKKKQILKLKIQKQLQQRNVKQGIKGLQRDVEAKVIFEQNQLNDNILEDDQNKRERILDEQEQRDKQSVAIVLKRYAPFIKKLYNRYANLKGAKKQFQQLENPQMAQVDLLRICKEKNIQKNKNTIIQILREVNNKNINSLNIDIFFKFLQNLCIEVYIKQKCSTKILMGDLMKKILRRMSQGQNFKLDQDDDQTCRDLTDKIRYNPHVQLPQGYKKIYQKAYKVNEFCSFPVKKAIKNQSYIACYQILNQILKDHLKLNIIQQQVRFLQEGRVIHKKQAYLPPKPIVKKQKQQVTLPLLAQKQTGEIKNKKPLIRSASRPIQHNQDKDKSQLTQNPHSKSRSKMPNQAQKKKQQQQQQNRKKKQQEEQLRKQRALQVKRKLQKQQEERQKQKQRKTQQKKQQQQKQEQQIRKEKEKKQKYQKEQKQKIQKFKKQQEQKQKQQKNKQDQVKKKQEQERKIKLKEQMKKEQQKRKQELEKNKRERQISEQKNKKKMEDEEKKKQLLKKQMMKKFGEQKQKLEINKISKQIMGKIYNEPQIQDLVNNKFKDQLKAIFNFGKQYNQFKLDKGNINVIEQKGWLTLCQQLNFCDPSTATKIIKNHIKQKNTHGITQEGLQQILFQLSSKKQIESDLQDYDKAKKACQQKFQTYLGGLKLPKGNQKLKEYFINLKNQVNKKKQQVVTNPNGQKQTWQIKQ